MLLWELNGSIYDAHVYIPLWNAGSKTLYIVSCQFYHEKDQGPSSDAATFGKHSLSNSAIFTA